MQNTSLGQLLRARRKELDLTIEELANKVGVDRTYFVKIEKHGLLPSPKVMHDIIINLKVKPTKYMRLYKSLMLERVMKNWKQKIKPLPEKF